MEKTKKKILIFVPEFPGISETFIEREISKLIEWNNIEITVFSLKKGQGETSDEVFKRVVYKRPGILSVLFSPFFCLFHFKKICDAYKLVCKNPNRSFFQTCYLFYKSILYAKMFKKYDPYIIYAHFMSEPSTICLIASQILECEFAIAAHAKDVLVTNSPMIFENAELVHIKAAKAKFITICNKYAYDKTLQLSGRNDSKNIYLIYHGVDFDKLLSVETPIKEKPPKTLIFTNGRFTEKKGHEFLIEASKILLERGFSHMVYILGGPGDYYDHTVKFINDLGMSENVKIIGEGKGVPFNEVVAYYRIADIYAFPSVNIDSGDADGISNTLIEASVYKVPIVSTDSGSTLEFLEDDRNSLIVPQADSYELANSIERLIVDRDLRVRLSEEAYKKAYEMFDINKNVKKIEDLLLS